MLVYRFNVVFEDEAEVLRVIDIKANQSFIDLHQAIQNAIGFDGSKPASFYMSSDHWRKGREISLEEKEGAALMETAKLNNYIADPHQKIVYISDYEEEWTLRLSLMRILQSESDKTYPLLFKSIGEAPKQYKKINPLEDPQNEFDNLVKTMLGGKLPADDEENDMDEEDDEDEENDNLEEGDDLNEEMGYDDDDYEGLDSIDGED
jgi:hypothetical protein